VPAVYWISIVCDTFLLSPYHVTSYFFCLTVVFYVTQMFF